MSVASDPSGETITTTTVSPYQVPISLSRTRPVWLGLVGRAAAGRAGEAGGGLIRHQSFRF